MRAPRPDEPAAGGCRSTARSSPARRAWSIVACPSARCRRASRAENDSTSSSRDVSQAARGATRDPRGRTAGRPRRSRRLRTPASRCTGRRGEPSRCAVPRGLPPPRDSVTATRARPTQEPAGREAPWQRCRPSASRGGSGSALAMAKTGREEERVAEAAGQRAAYLADEVVAQAARRLESCAAPRRSNGSDKSGTTRSGSLDRRAQIERDRNLLAERRVPVEDHPGPSEHGLVPGMRQVVRERRGSQRARGRPRARRGGRRS